MLSEPGLSTVPPRSRPGTPRLRLKPQAPVTGFVDGAWWPRSRDLVAELPALAELLGERLGGLRRVVFPLDAWEPAPRRTEVGGYRVRLEGFRYQDENLLHVIGAAGERVSLLVVPTDAGEDDGASAMTAAGTAGNTDRPEDLLAGRHAVAGD